MIKRWKVWTLLAFISNLEAFNILLVWSGHQNIVKHMQKQKTLEMHQKKIVVMMRWAMRTHQVKMKWQVMLTLNIHNENYAWKFVGKMKVSSKWSRFVGSLCTDWVEECKYVSFQTKSFEVIPCLIWSTFLHVISALANLCSCLEGN